MLYDTNINFSESGSEPLQTNPAFINPTGFRLLIDSRKYKNSEFTVQTFSLPDMSITPAMISLPGRNLSLSPDNVEYSPFELTFLVDQNFINYKEIHEWILGMATEPDMTSIRKVRDISLMVLSSHNNLTREIKFVDAFPISLSSLQFDVTNTSVEYLVASVTFQYSYYKIL